MEVDRSDKHDTLVVFTSDNGLFWGEHKLREKFLPYRKSVSSSPLLCRFFINQST